MKMKIVSAKYPDSDEAITQIPTPKRDFKIALKKKKRKDDRDALRQKLNSVSYYKEIIANSKLYLNRVVRSSVDSKSGHVNCRDNVYPNTSGIEVDSRLQDVRKSETAIIKRKPVRKYRFHRKNHRKSNVKIPNNSTNSEILSSKIATSASPIRRIENSSNEPPNNVRPVAQVYIATNPKTPIKKYGNSEGTPDGQFPNDYSFISSFGSHQSMDNHQKQDISYSDVQQVNRKLAHSQNFRNSNTSPNLYYPYPPFHPMTNQSSVRNISNNTPEGFVFKFGAEWVRVEELSLVLLVLLLWIAAITMFFNRWGKLRMLEPYQPAYNATDAPAAARPGAVPCATIPGQSAIVPPAPIPKASNSPFIRPKRIESLNSFRDNFREGYKDAYRYINIPTKPFASGLGGLGLRGMTGVRQIGSTTLGIGLGQFAPNAGVHGFRRASSGSALGININDYDNSRRSVSRAGSRSNSVSGSTNNLHHFTRALISSSHNVGSPSGSGDYRLIHSPESATYNTNEALLPRKKNVTCIKITNTEDEEEISYHGSYEDFPESENNSLRTTQESFCSSTGLRPLSNQIKVRSAVDLVTLVMQDRRNFM